MKKKVILFSSIFFAFDFFIKVIVNSELTLMERIIVIPNFFSLTKVFNYGASWNIFSGKKLFLIIVSLVVLVFLTLYKKRFKNNNRNILMFSLLYGGILGNLFDRTFYGYVIDYLDFYIFGYDYPVFNFADICIVFGVILMIVAILKKEDVYDNRS